MFVDTHAHYDDEAFDADRREVLASLPGAGVDWIVNAAQDVRSARRCILLAEEFDFVYAAVGIHPHEAASCTPEAIRELAALARHPRVVAVGETGLDYHYDFCPPEKQKENLTENLRLAEETGLPVILHDREAHADVLEILLRRQVPAGKAVFHCYSGSAEMARVIASHGWYFSVGGAVTFKNARRIREALAVIPDTLLMLETDCPYMAPVPLRGTRNLSSNIKYIAEEVAAVKGLSCEEVCRMTGENAARFFGISAQKSVT